MSGALVQLRTQRSKFALQPSIPPSLHHQACTEDKNNGRARDHYGRSVHAGQRSRCATEYNQHPGAADRSKLPLGGSTAEEPLRRLEQNLSLDLFGRGESPHGRENLRAGTIGADTGDICAVAAEHQLVLVPI